MKRLHVHMSVDNLDQSVRFYSTLFGSAPSVVKVDYAKWMLDDPRINFAISTHNGRAAGVDHLGIEVEDADELQDVYVRLKAADRPVLEEGMTTCCYARSEKSWISDPAGVAWETFHTVGERTTYGTAAPMEQITKGGAGCGPSPSTTAAPTKACRS
jgi:catechol 2,3-dioxygenase-like lactoylglutathione lyase family enzyme